MDEYNIRILSLDMFFCSYGVMEVCRIIVVEVEELVKIINVYVVYLFIKRFTVQ